ncbi:C2 domain-containing protein 3 [Neosynchiropus ocellatus]
MKSRNHTSVKAGSSRKKVLSDVTPSTSLPPLVEGHVRCLMKVTVSRVLWTVPKPPPATFVRLRWWGESSDGTHFFPRDGSQLSQKIIKTTACFPICCGSKQFTSYLADMGTMHLEVLTKHDHLPCAKAQISGISSLSVTRSISGFYTLVSPTSKKLGELQVSLSLEPQSDCRKLVPARDVGMNGPPAIKITAPAEPRPPLAAPHKQSARSGRSIPRGKDHLYFRKTKDDHVSLENLNPSSTICVNQSVKETEGHSTGDIISIVPECGDQLKHPDLGSGDHGSGQTLKDAPLPLQRDNAQPLSSSGTLLQNILHSESALPTRPDGAADSAPDAASDIDYRAIELLFGRLDKSGVPQLDCDEPYSASPSEHSSVCADSELNDPQFDQSLLDDLFYKNPMLNSRTDDEEAGLLRNSPVEKPVSPSGRCNGDNRVSAPQSENHGIPLSPEQLSQLCSIRSAKVSVISLAVTSSPKMSRCKGKLSPSATGIKCTYFVEFVFPMIPGPCRRGKAPEQKVIRAVSSKVAGGVVTFQQSSSFPVQFSHANADEWWSSDLVFSIYSRRSHQKKAVLVGKAVHSLGCLLQNPQLSQTVTLPVLNVEGVTHEIGPLKVSLELVVDNFYSENLKRSDTRRKPPAIVRHLDISREEESSQVFADSRSPENYLKVSSFHSDSATSPRETLQPVEEEPVVLLHTLLMVPDGKDLNDGPSNSLNLYLNCKQFWSDEMARSVVSWGQADPCFNFVQVTPVALTSKLLERMKNNVMVIEVWRKMGSSEQDQLFGLVKLPLHQFYMSFRQQKIAELLLQAQYPVLGVDCYMPVVDVLSGLKGHLRVVLAMGRSEQILALQQTRDGIIVSPCPSVTQRHLPDHQQQAEVNVTEDTAVREHLFVIRVEGIHGLMPLQSTVWGEADCFVQYSFPCQGTGPDRTSDESADIALKCFRTTTSLCLPDPVFGHTETHVLLAPDDVPVQQLLLRSLPREGSAGVQFEVWCRYYYPNVRDQLVAKGILPLSRLCTMLTVQRPDEPKTFSLPLVPQIQSPKGRDPQPSGVLDVCIRYKHRPVRAAGMSVRGAAPRLVTLVVEVHRACGLQAAARVVSQRDGRFSYFAGVGVNAYVTVQLSFLPDNERRCTRVAARNFCPEFDHHTEVSCDLLHQRNTGETCSLAERLAEASAVFTVWNRDNRKKGLILEELKTHLPLQTLGRIFSQFLLSADTARLQDVMLGVVKIPLADLLRKRTGISGWFGVFLPQEPSSSLDQNISVGAVELSVCFAQRFDREKIIKAANGLGWEMSRLDPEWQDDETFWEGNGRKTCFTLSMPRVWIPVHCLLLPGHTEVQRSTYCYFRYKFYDKDAVCSQMKHPTVLEGNQATVSFDGSRVVELMRTPPLMWYLQEEKLEIQVWVAFKKDKTQRPSDTDRLVGSAFLDLSSLARTSDQKLSLSGVYPLFRSSAPDLQGAALRVHITRTSCGYTTVPDNQSDSEEEEFGKDADAANQVPPSSIPTQSYLLTRHQRTSSESPPEVSSAQQRKDDSEESFPVTITVDRAMHLNLKGCPLAERDEKALCCCVSYVTADSSEPVSTAVVSDTDCPLWDHQHECRLSKQLLVDPQQSLVFKVWHRGDTARVIGFASVDLSPLLCGFQSVCGWYNITDFGGHCHGQLKVSVTPLKWVQDLRGQRRTVQQGSYSHSSPPLQIFPVNYHTTATYSSFPSHISRYPEQVICSPEESFFSEKSVGSDRHSEHMDNVRMYHQSLQEQTAARSVCSSSSASDSNPSSSVLFSTLRKKLSELDNIQKYFSHKVATPCLFPPTSAAESHVTQGQDCEQETNTSELLLKSKQLVGEVDKIVCGFRGQNLETIPSIPESHSPSSLGDDPVTIPGANHSGPIRGSVSSEELVSQLPSQTPKLSDGVDSEVEDEERGLRNGSVDEHGPLEEDDEDDKSECSGEEEDEDGGDYDAVLVKPRQLNELTCLTDKTSPWTSILSDPDLDTVESDEASDHAEEEQVLHTSLTPTEPPLDCGGEQDGSMSDENEDPKSVDSEEAAGVDGEDAERAVDVAEDGDADSSLTRAQVTESPQEASPSLNNEDTDPELAIPNFFLPTHQLEASLRAIRLAPTFSLSSGDPERHSSTDNRSRAPRQRPDMSPLSRKKELERIAKIFQAHFDPDQS